MGYRIGFLGLLVASMASAAPVQWSVNGHFYERIAPPSGISWTSARSAAQALTHMGLPGHLATLTSAAEAQFVYTNTNAASGYTWIGFTDEVNEGTYRWVTGEPTAYTDWLANEPNNQASNPPGEDYAMIDFREPDGGWNDYQNFTGILGGPPIAYLVEYEAIPEPSAGVIVFGLAIGLSRRSRK